MGKSVAFLENGSWYHRTKVMNEDYTVGYGKKGGFKTQEEAEESYYKYENEFKLKSAGNILKLDDDVTFKSYLIYWFENIYSTRIETTTKMVGAYSVYKLIIPNIEEDIKIKLVTPEYFNDLLKRIATMCAKTSANKAREIISGVLKEAYATGMITYNPIKEIDYYERNSKKVPILNKRQLKQLLEVASKDNWYLEILLGVFCGLRRGEIQGLKFSDFDMEEKTVTISRQLISEYYFDNNMDIRGFKINDYSLTERNPKTINAFRRLRVPDVVIEQVKNRMKLKEYYKLKDKEFKDDDYISFQPNGVPHGVNSFNGYLKRICKKYGLPHITVHSLRHMYGTILTEQNVELAKISALLGHDSIHTTFEFYCDVMEDTENINAYMNNEFTPNYNEEARICN